MAARHVDFPHSFINQLNKIPGCEKNMFDRILICFAYYVHYRLDYMHYYYSVCLNLSSLCYCTQHEYDATVFLFFY